MTIVIRRAAALVDLYVDGNLFSSTPISLASGASVSNTEPLLIGKAAGGYADFAGKLDELELFRRALDESEAEALHLAGHSGKCKDTLGVPWDEPFCADDLDAVVPVEVCNHSTTSKSYDLSFASLPAVPCDVDGPVDFEDAITAALPPLSLSVAGQSCVTKLVRIGRPVGFVADGLVGCYQVILEDVATGGTLIRIGSVEDKRNDWIECGLPPFPLPWVLASALSGSQVIDPQDPDKTNDVTFELGNNTGSELQVDYLIEAMPDRVALDGGRPGRPVTGSALVPAGGVATVTVRAGNLGTNPFTYDDIVISTDTKGEGDFVALRSVGVRTALPTETVVANPDRATLTLGSQATLAVTTNDLSAKDPLDPASLRLTLEPTYGEATVNDDGTVTYRASPIAGGVDGFVYEICDEAGTCDDAPVTLVIDGSTLIFSDGFELGDTSRWSSTP